MSTQIDHYAVMGNPVAHSQSPRIHQLFAEQTQQAICYEKILVPLDGFTEAVTKFFAKDGKGLNITLPFKHQALTLADEANDAAKISGAANTLSINTAGKIIANNTDGIGLVNDLTHRCQINILKQRILLIGAGGAARNVIASLFAESPAQLHIASRRENKSQQLRQHFATLGKISASGLGNIGDTPFDLIINATSASLQGKVPPLNPAILASECCCYDMVYANEPTAFMQWAQALGVRKTFDGLGMLIEQAAESFYIWRDVRPQTQPVFQVLRRAF